VDLLDIYARLSGLAHDDAAFEAARLRILSDAAADVPAARIASWRALQDDLDRLRRELPRAAYFDALLGRIAENLDNLDDLFDAIRVQCDEFDPARPRWHALQSDRSPGRGA